MAAGSQLWRSSPRLRPKLVLKSKGDQGGLSSKLEGSVKVPRTRLAPTTPRNLTNHVRARSPLDPPTDRCHRNRGSAVKLVSRDLRRGVARWRGRRGPRFRYGARGGPAR